MPVMTIDAPFGPLTLREEDEKLTGLEFGNTLKPNETQRETQLLYDTALQLKAYFKGQIKAFNLPLYLKGTCFQQKVWGALCNIPYGKTCSYAHIAKQVESPKAFRAVGMANNKNPLAIIVPCHRVIGANGTLTGYGGGLDVKQFLLNLEKNNHN